MSERNLLEVLRITFLLQTFSYISLCLQVYIEIVGLPLAAVSVNGLTLTMLRLLLSKAQECKDFWIKNI